MTHELVKGLPVIHLSAAYDVVTTDSGAIAHEFMIADDVVEPDLEAALSVHSDFGLQEARARAVVSEVVRVVDGWREHFSGLGVTPGDIERLAGFIDAEHLATQRDRHRTPPSNTGRKAPARKPRTGTPKIFR